MAFEGKVIAITGGASGIGLATAKLLSSRGATICIADNDALAISSAEKYFTELKFPYHALQLDVTNRLAVDSWIATIITTYHHLDGAVNSAGIIGRAHGLTHLTEMRDDEWLSIISVNLTGMMYCLRAELQHIDSGGSIVNISSIQGVMGFPGSAAYSASKHGVIGLTRSVAKEVGDRNLRVNAIAPGAIQTPLLEKAMKVNPNEGSDGLTAIKRLGTAEEIAAICAFLLGSESTFVTGAVYGADGGWNC